MTFDVAADAYASFMGRFAGPLAEQFVDLVGLEPGWRVLDVGCGPGTVTAVLVDRVGADHVAAVDASPSFVPAVRDGSRTSTCAGGGRGPAVRRRDLRRRHVPAGGAVHGRPLAWAVRDGSGGAARWRRRRVCVGLRTRPGPGVLTCRGGARPRCDGRDRPGGSSRGAPRRADDGGWTGGRAIDGLDVEIATFEEWWAPFAYRIGPAGDYFATLTPADQSAPRTRCAELLPREPIEITGVPRAATARRPG